jgi:phosphinothricin acetyltransferase
VPIRLARPHDAAAVGQIYAPAIEESAISFELEVPSVDEMRRRIERTMPDYPWIVAEVGGRVVGYAYADAFSDRAAYRWSVATSVYVDAAAQGRGHGRELYSALFDVLAMLGYREALAGIALPNAASVGLHESFGFEPVAHYRRVGWKLGRWHDVGWWQRSIGDGALGDPAPSVTLRELADAELARVLNQRSVS